MGSLPLGSWKNHPPEARRFRVLPQAATNSEHIIRPKFAALGAILIRRGRQGNAPGYGIVLTQ
jgi:hypothetical protein